MSAGLHLAVFGIGSVLGAVIWIPWVMMKPDDFLDLVPDDSTTQVRVFAASVTVSLLLALAAVAIELIVLTGVLGVFAGAITFGSYSLAFPTELIARIQEEWERQMDLAGIGPDD